MPQAYGEKFARIYNMRWSAFANQVSPLIRSFYEQKMTDPIPKTLLDLGCGTGKLALHFLEHGYRVTGLDLSSAMLAVARENAQEYLVEKQARFVVGDAAEFTLEDETFGLVVATYDTLNHLPDLAALESCFHSVYGVLLDPGWFIFDLNTLVGLHRWGGVTVQDEPDLVLINRGVVVKEMRRAYTYITGFFRQDDERFERFDEVVYNTAFDLEAVAATLRQVGFSHVHVARVPALDVPLAAPEEEGRVFILAQK